MSFSASAPGSLMLLGEYGVLYGQSALVCALDQRITVTLTPRQDKQVVIASERHGYYVTDLSALTAPPAFRFVLETLKPYQAKLKYGCDITIESTFSDQVGFGSSAAVTVATLAALCSWLKIPCILQDLVKQGRAIVRRVQGTGSGADVAASVYGGIVAYRAQPFWLEKITVDYPLTILYAGFKTPTAEVIKKVERFFAPYPPLFSHLCHSIGECAAQGIALVRRKEWKRLGEMMTVQQGLMEALGVSMPLLHQMVEDLRQQEGIVGAKISGSGLGDCVVGLGELPAAYAFSLPGHSVQRLQAAMTGEGVRYEKT